MKAILKLAFVSLAISYIVLLTGCQNTVSGFTDDVSRNTSDFRRSINS